MIRSKILLLLLCAIIIFKGCSTVKENDAESSVRFFLEGFEKNLALADDVILKQFQLKANADVTQEGILKAIRIMQNRLQAEDSVVCTINFKGAVISLDGGSTLVKVPAEFTSLDPAYPLSAPAEFELHLATIDGQLVITDIDAQSSFYYKYMEAVHDLSSRKHRERDLASRQHYFDKARMLQETYDTVVWYSLYKDSIYFYVVNGEWKNYFLDSEATPSTSAKMGLVSETGRVIIPPAYELIGTISFESEGIVEVKKDGRVGQFTMDGKEIVAPVYDWIVPYDDDNVYALVKQDSINGWLDNSYTYHAGFPSADAKLYVKEFAYLGRQIVISDKTTITSEILDAEHMGFGIVIPPIYYVQSGVFSEIIPYLFTGDNSLGWGGTESVETRGSFFETISQNFSALMVKLNDNYLEGREGFYERTKLTILDANNEPVISEVMSSGKILFNKIDSTLIEIQITGEEVNNDGGYDEMYGDTWYAPQFKYLLLQDGTITKLDSKRYYDFAEFVKLDSSYFIGTFGTWNEEHETYDVTSFASNEVLTSVRNEILAAYGFTFADKETLDRYKNVDWYAPRYSRYEDFLASMTEVDRYNLEFLERMVETVDAPEL